MVKKIISGGQVGADQAALDVALKLDIPHGGWIQKGRKTQSGILPKKYKLKEMATASSTPCLLLMVARMSSISLPSSR